MKRLPSTATASSATYPSPNAGRTKSLRLLFISAIACSCLIGCGRKFRVGDHVLVEWRGGQYPAVITSIEGVARFRVHYDGFSDDWDESIPGTRVLERLPEQITPSPAAGWGPAAASGSAKIAGPAAPATSGAATSGAATSGAPRPNLRDLFKAGDRVRVEWHRATYPATVIAVPEPDRYRVHYDGLGDEWDETVAASRISRR